MLIRYQEVVLQLLAISEALTTFVTVEVGARFGFNVVY
jgi:hypothetical protein